MSISERLDQQIHEFDVVTTGALLSMGTCVASYWKNVPVKSWNKCKKNTCTSAESRSRSLVGWFHKRNLASWATQSSWPIAEYIEFGKIYCYNYRFAWWRFGGDPFLQWWESMRGCPPLQVRVKAGESTLFTFAFFKKKWIGRRVTNYYITKEVAPMGQEQKPIGVITAASNGSGVICSMHQYKGKNNNYVLERRMENCFAPAVIRHKIASFIDSRCRCAHSKWPGHVAIMMKERRNVHHWWIDSIRPHSLISYVSRHWPPMSQHFPKTSWWIFILWRDARTSLAHCGKGSRLFSLSILLPAVCLPSTGSLAPLVKQKA